MFSSEVLFKLTLSAIDKWSKNVLRSINYTYSEDLGPLSLEMSS